MNWKIILAVSFVAGFLLLLGCTQQPSGKAFKMTAEKDIGLPIKKCTPAKYCKDLHTLAKRYGDCSVRTTTCEDICCNAACTSSVCDTNSSCDDQNAMTIDICQNSGTCEAYCSNELNFPPTAWIEFIPSCSKPDELFSVGWRAYDIDGIIQSVGLEPNSNCTLWDANSTGMGTSFASGTKRYKCPADPYVVFFTLMAWDDDWASGSDTNAITIDANCTVPRDIPPIANAGGDYNGNTSTTLLITGTGTDTDGVIVDLNWTNIGSTDINCTIIDQNWTGIGTSYAVIQSQLWCPNPGNYWVQLYTRDNDWLYDTDDANVFITE